MKRRWWLTAALSGLLITTLLLFQQLPQLLEQWLGRELAQFGIEEFHLAQPSLGTGRISSAKMNFAGSLEGWRYRVAATEIRADDYWPALLGGNIRKLSLASVVLQIAPADSGQAGIPVLDIHALLAQLSALELAAATIEIKALEIGIEQADGLLFVTGNQIVVDGKQQTIAGNLSTELPAQLASARIQLKPGDDFPWVPDLSMVLSRHDDEFLWLSAELQPGKNEQQLELQLALQLEQAEMSPLLDGLGVEPLVSSARLHLEGNIAVPGIIDITDESWREKFSFAGRISGVSTATHLLPGLLETAEFGFDVAVSKAGQQLLIQTRKPLSIKTIAVLDAMPEVERALGASAPLSLAITANSPEPVRLSLSGKQPWELSAGNWDLQINTSEKNLSAAIAVPYFLSGQTTKLRLLGTISAPYRGRLLPATQVSADISQTGKSWLLGGDYKIADWKTGGDWSAKIDGGNRSVSATARMESIPDTFRQLQPWLGELPEIRLVEGIGSLTYSWQAVENTATPRQSLKLTLENLTGIVDGVSFVNAAINGELQKHDRWRSRTPMLLQIGQLSSGLRLEDIELHLQLQPSERIQGSRWRLEELSASLFSGNLALQEPATIDYPFSGNRLQFQLSDLSLGDLLLLYAEQGIRGTGRISGSIPLILEAGGVRIDKALLRNTSPGTLQFTGDQSGALQAGNPQLAMAIRLLENFRYDLLEASAKFERSGQLLLGVKLSGNNPTEFDGRQVNFNINLEENLFDLLKVLQLSDDITRKLEQRLEAR